MRRRPWLIVILLCVSIVVILGFVKFLQIRAAIAFGESFPEPSETVLTHVVSLSDWQPTITVAGEVRASRELVIRNEVSGIVSSVGFESGGQVSKGTVLLQLDDAEERAQLLAVMADKTLAEQDVARLKGLVKTRAVSEQQADQASARLAMAKGQEAAIREAIINKRIIAPFDGHAGLHQLEPGQFLSAETMITRLVGGLDSLWIDFSLPQQYSNIQLGTPVTLDVELATSNPPVARVIAVDAGVSAMTRSIMVRALYPNRERLLKPGFFVEVAAPAGAPRTAVKLPSTAVRVDAFGNFVFVVEKSQNAQNRAVRRPITVLAQVADYSVIETGLQPGEIVATQGSFKLRDGILVNIAGQAQAESLPVVTPVQAVSGVELETGVNIPAQDAPNDAQGADGASLEIDQSETKAELGDGTTEESLDNAVEESPNVQ